MRIGPFRKSESDSVSNLLKERGVPHTVILDEEVLQANMDRVNVGVRHNRTAEFDDAFHFVDLEEKEAAKLGNELVKLGVIVTPFEPSFESEEYLCKKCGYVSQMKTTCPKHGGTLVDFSEYAAYRSDRKTYGAPWLIWTILIGVMGTLAYYFVTSLIH